MTYKFNEDKQSRITRYGVQCFQVSPEGTKFHGWANAKKKGNKLIVSNAWKDLIHEDGTSVTGEYEIVQIVPKGRLSDMFCKRIQN